MCLGPKSHLPPNDVGQCYGCPWTTKRQENGLGNSGGEPETHEHGLHLILGAYKKDLWWHEKLMQLEKETGVAIDLPMNHLYACFQPGGTLSVF